MGLLDNDTTTTSVSNNKVVEENAKKSIISDTEIDSWFEKRDKYRAKKVCMVLGEDGVGKSGLVLNHIARELKKDKEATAMVIDLDQGASPLIDHYLDISDRMIVRDPLTEKTIEENGELVINWQGVMTEIIKISNYVAKNRERKNIKFFVLDGLSKLLEVAENQMRIDKYLQADGGANQAYWKLRKMYFFRCLDIMKTIPIDSFFIGHSNFFLKEGSTAVITQVNATMFQRIICSKLEISPTEEKYIAKITKSKLNLLKEGNEITFMHKKDKKIVFDSTKVFENL